MSEGRDHSQLCPPQLVVWGHCWTSKCCCYWQNENLAFHRSFYDKSCYWHTVKIHGLQAENSSYFMRDINCSKPNCIDHRIKFLVLIFKRALTLKNDVMLSKSLFSLEAWEIATYSILVSWDFSKAYKIWTWAWLLHTLTILTWTIFFIKQWGCWNEIPR